MTSSGITLEVWGAGGAPRSVDAAGEIPDGIAWFDVPTGLENLDRVYAATSARCSGITREVLEDLLDPDERPGVSRDVSGGLNVVTTFRVRTVPEEEGGKRPTSSTEPGDLIFDPVEMCIGDDWLITCRHAPEGVIRGQEVEGIAPKDFSAELDNLVAVWEGHHGDSPADLATMLMGQLALTYENACRRLKYWLEDWELVLYREEETPDGEALVHLWECMTRLRGWLSALKINGLSHAESIDRSLAWWPQASPQETQDVDKRVVSALKRMTEMADTLRGSFHALHEEQAREKAKAEEDNHRRFERWAIVFLVPTFLASLAGANTWVPGEHNHWGFIGLVAAMLVLTFIPLWKLGLLPNWLKLSRGSDESEEVAD